MLRALLVFLLFVLTLVGPWADAPHAFGQSVAAPQAPHPAPPAPTGLAAMTPVAEVARPARLIFWNREIVTLRMTWMGVSPQERVQRALDRLAALPSQENGERVGVQPSRLGEVDASAVVLGSVVLFSVLPQDVEQEFTQTAASVAAEAAERVRAALRARAAQTHPSALLRAAAAAAAATLGLIAALAALVATRRFLLRRIHALHAKVVHPRFGVDVGRYLFKAEAVAVRAVSVSIGAVLVYTWLSFVLTRFAYTEPWGHALGDYLVALFSTLGLDALRALPGLFAVLVIFVAARYLVRVVSVFAEAVAQRRIQVSWLRPETVAATRRVVVVLIWLFAIIVAYPYIPGSNTEAFKGVSVFAGLMLTIGSAGFIGHLMAGLLVVYSRALHEGEMVKVGDTIGVVTQVGSLSTKVMTQSMEEVTIPNAVLMSSTVVNYSRLAGTGGAILSTRVTIGYDVPWRQVHAMLLLAAERTKSVRKHPKPFVLQNALSDFYVEYELRVHLDAPENRFTVLSDLHAQIQDAFNEFGVQILSPHFMVQPDRTVVVPRTDWYTAPASKDMDTHAGAPIAPPGQNPRAI